MKIKALAVLLSLTKSSGALDLAILVTGRHPMPAIILLSYVFAADPEVVQG